MDLVFYSIEENNWRKERFVIVSDRHRSICKAVDLVLLNVPLHVHGSFVEEPEVEL